MRSIDRKTNAKSSCQEVTLSSSPRKLARIDLLGSITLSITIRSAVGVLDMGGQKYSFSHPIIITAIVLAVVLSFEFALLEKILRQGTRFSSLSSLSRLRTHDKVNQPRPMVKS